MEPVVALTLKKMKLQPISQVAPILFLLTRSVDQSRSSLRTGCIDTSQLKPGKRVYSGTQTSGGSGSLHSSVCSGLVSVILTPVSGIWPRSLVTALSHLSWKSTGGSVRTRLEPVCCSLQWSNFCKCSWPLQKWWQACLFIRRSDFQVLFYCSQPQSPFSRCWQVLAKMLSDTKTETTVPLPCLDVSMKQGWALAVPPASNAMVSV